MSLIFILFHFAASISWLFFDFSCSGFASLFSSFSFDFVVFSADSLRSYTEIIIIIIIIIIMVIIIIIIEKSLKMKKPRRRSPFSYHLCVSMF